MDSPHVGPTRLGQAEAPARSGRPDERPVRVLVTGEAFLRYESRLEEDGVELIGCTGDVEEAFRMLQASNPDIVLLAPHTTDDVRLPSTHIPVVVLAPSGDVVPGEEEPVGAVEFRLMQIALALASAMPARRLICLSGVGED